MTRRAEVRITAFAGGIINNAVTVGKPIGLSLLLGGVLLLAAGSAGAGSNSSAGASARAFAIRVVVPGQPSTDAGSVSAPPYRVSVGPSFAYPADGTIVTTGSLSTSATSDSGSTASSTAFGEAQSVSLFGGEISAASVTAKATGSTRGRTARGALSSSSISGLTVLGQPAAVSPNGRVTLADWGYLITLEQGTDSSPGPGGAQAFHGFITALDVHLTAPHGGLPADSEIQIGYAEVNVRAPAQPQRQPVAPGSSTHAGKKTPRAPGPSGGAPLLGVPSGLHPKLTAGGYVFPVYGPSSFVDTFGTYRPDTPGNWHHGDDIFAPLGAPILACADGIVFSVGWNNVGGNRLWLRDADGNEFYYAHLSAFSPLARNGRHVRAGEVLGFVGNTGDAAGTPTHLHFEIHPSSLIFMGYDGAVDPTVYLTAWQHLQDVRFENVAGWVASAISDPAPKPAAILLQVSDISEASGLDPGSLQRAIAARVPGAVDQTLLRSLASGLRPARGPAAARAGG
ncbi:MAG: M23 family metallopeptidase [Gaiellaceae bacterium]